MGVFTQSRQYVGSISIIAGFDSATSSWVSAVVTNGGSVSAGRQTAVDNLIVGLKSDGIWTKLDRLWLLAGENAQSARTDLLAHTLATVVGSPTFTTDRGYTGSDLATATNYLNSNFNPVSAGANVTLNSVHISAWSITNNAVANGGVLIGHNNGSTSGMALFDPEVSSGFIAGRVNDLSGGTGGTLATKIGHWLANRSDSTHSQIYKNASLYASPNATSVALSNFNVYMLAQNGGGTAFSGSPQQVAMVSMGGNLSSTDVTNFYNRLRTYMTAVGVP